MTLYGCVPPYNHLISPRQRVSAERILTDTKSIGGPTLLNLRHIIQVFRGKTLGLLLSWLSILSSVVGFTKTRQTTGQPEN